MIRHRHSLQRSARFPWIGLALGLCLCALTAPAPLIPDVQTQTTKWSREWLRQHDALEALALLGATTNTFGYYNARDYGVVGDGVTDDTAALKALVETTARADVIYLPAGTYLVSEPVIWHPYTSILGAGGVTAGQASDSATTIKAATNMACLIQTASWTNNTFNHFGRLAGLYLDANYLATNGLQIFAPGEDCSVDDVHIGKALKSGMWLAGNAATFRGNDIIINRSGDYAIRFSQHPSYSVANGSWYFNGLSGDANTNGWIFCNVPQMIGIEGWKVEQADKRLVRVTDATYDSMSPGTFSGASRVYLSIQDGTADWAAGALTNVMLIDGTTTAVDFHIGLARFSGQSALSNLVWNAVTGKEWPLRGTLGRIVNSGYYSTGGFQFAVGSDVDIDGRLLLRTNTMATVTNNSVALINSNGTLFAVSASATNQLLP